MFIALAEIETIQLLRSEISRPCRGYENRDGTRDYKHFVPMELRLNDWL
jgi:hypothetical protein